MMVLRLNLPDGLLGFLVVDVVAGGAFLVVPLLPAADLSCFLLVLFFKYK